MQSKNNIIQYVGIIITVSTILIAVGVAKNSLDNVKCDLENHVIESGSRNYRTDEAITKLSIIAERLTVQTENLNKNIDELKREIKK